jgi:TPR repeat protein
MSGSGSDGSGGQSPALKAYREAWDVLEQIQDFCEEPSSYRKLKAHRLVLQSCFHRLLKEADSQGPVVWHAVGQGYNSGRGTGRDSAQAVIWFERAAGADYVPAMLALAFCLSHPRPSAGRALALEWYREAAEKGASRAMVSLGFACREGEGVPCDYDQALCWFKRAVKAGDADSLMHVGRMYASYLSSPAEAVPWFLRAAQAGVEDSFIALACLYEIPILHCTIRPKPTSGTA